MSFTNNNHYAGSTCLMKRSNYNFEISYLCLEAHLQGRCNGCERMLTEMNRYVTKSKIIADIILQGFVSIYHKYFDVYL